MKPSFRIVTTAAAVALYACSFPLRIGVVNNTGEVVTIVSGEKTFLIPSGSVARFFYPTVAERRRFRATFNSCIFTYEMPDSIESYSQFNGFNGEVMVQLEKNSRLHLIPPASIGAVALSDVASLQNDGFPVSPTEKHCRQPTEPKA